MKKILFGTNILFLGIIFFQAYNNSSKKAAAVEKSIKQEYVDDSIKLVQKVKMKEQLPGFRFEAFEFMGGIIDDDVARIMSKKYEQDISKSRINGMGNPFKLFQDTRSIRFSLETLKKFIEKIEKSTSNNKCNLATGITFYYGIYPKADEIQRHESLKSLDENFVADKHTLFMVPSYLDENIKAWVDFNYNEIGKDACHPTPYSVLMKDTVKYRSAIMAFDKNTIVYPGGNPAFFNAINDALQNHGGMAPPPAGSGTFPSPGE
jgi:hypothetical protein